MKISRQKSSEFCLWIPTPQLKLNEIGKKRRKHGHFETGKDSILSHIAEEKEELQDDNDETTPKLKPIITDVHNGCIVVFVIQ